MYTGGWARKGAHIMDEGRMMVRVHSVCPETFRGKNGEPDTSMYRIYLSDARGRVGSLYTRTEVHAGDLVVLGLAERDGKLKLSLLGLAGQAPHI